MGEQIRLKYERNLSHTYLVYEGDFEENEYVVQMILHNSIDGVLKCRIDKVDGRGRLYYEISSKQSVMSIFEKKKITYNILRQLLDSFKDILMKLEEYLLPEEYLMMEPDYIYMEPEQNIFYFCIVPYDKEPNGMQPLLEFLLEHIDYTDEKAVAMAYEWYKRAGEENYSFMNVYRQVFMDKEYKDVPLEKKIKDEKVITGQERVKNKENIEWSREETGHMQYDEEKCEKNEDNQKQKLDRQWYIAAAIGVLVVVVAVLCAIYIGIKEAAVSSVILLVLSIVLYRKYMEKEEETCIWEEEEDEEEEIYEAEILPELKKDLYEEKEVRKEEVLEDSANKEYGETVFITNEVIKNGHVLKPLANEFPLLGISFFPYIIGKLAGAVDGVIEHETVSRIHCKLEFENENYYIRDLNSTNGTIVNGTVVGTEERMEIQCGDEIQIGQALYVFE